MRWIALSDADIEAAIARYVRERDRYQKLTDFVHETCTKLVRENAIPATVQSRSKDPERLRGKLRKKREEFGSIDEVFGPAGFKDFAGVRVATYVERDRGRVVKEIQERFAGPADGEVAVDVREVPNFYRATHCLVILSKDDLVAGYENLTETRCEIQVCSLLAHVWNEIDHDRAYKPMTGELNAQEKQALDNLGHLTRIGDGIIEALLTATDQRLSELQGEFEDQWDFVARARKLFPGAADFGNHSGQLFEELATAGIDSVEKVRGFVGEDGEAEAAALLQQLQQHLDEESDGVVGALDPGSSDLLLMLLLRDQAEAVLSRHPAGRGKGRPPRIASIARRYVEMTKATE